MAKTFCEHCKEETEYDNTKTVLTGKIGGRDYQYLGIVAHCTKCDKPIWTPESNDYNLDRLWDEFEKANPGCHRPNN